MIEMKKPEIRKDYFRERYVIFAPNRAKRPNNFAATVEAAAKVCHFCPANFKDETITYRHDNSDKEWDVIAVINKFAALSLDNHSAYGQAEVVIETRRHDLNINDLAIEHIVAIFDAYIDRFMTLRNIDGIRHVIIFKNEGGKAGASIPHSHSQIIALPVLPPQTEREASAYSKYRLENVTCPYCDILGKEADSPRAIWEDENVLAIAPYASKDPYGVWFIPKRHVRLIAELTHSEKVSLAKAMKLVLGKLDELGIPYNYFVENAVNSEDYHMHIKLEPRANTWAGLELGTGVIINPVMPEDAAKLYRDK